MVPDFVREQSYAPLVVSEQDRLRRWRRSTFCALLVGYIGYYLCRGNLAAAFPLLEQEFGYSNVQLGVIASLSEIAYAIGKFINGPATDRVGGRRIFLIGMGGAILFNILFSLSASLMAFIVVWCCCRYFLSMGWGGMTKTIGNWYKRRNYGTVMGLLSVSIQFGGVAATLLAGFLVLLGVGWQGLFIYPAALLFLILTFALLVSRDSPDSVIDGASVPVEDSLKPIADYGQQSKASVRDIVLTLLRLPIFQLVLLFSFLTTFLRSVFLFWTPMFLFSIGLDASSAILQSAIFPLMGVAGTVYIGWYTDRHSHNQDRAGMMWKMLVVLVFCLLAIAALSASAQPDFASILVLLGASGFFLLGPYSMSAGCLSLDIAGAEGAGSSTGVIDGVGYLGGASAAITAGAMSEVFGWQQVFVMLAVLSLLSALTAGMMSIHFRRMHRKPEASSAADSPKMLTE